MTPKISVGFRQLITFLILTTCLSGLVYIAVQQSFRMNANDPQIQMAEDGANALSKGEVPAAIVPRNIIEMSESLAPFIMVLDSTGSVLESSATINGKVPKIPAGVLAYAKAHGEDRVTWQPADGVRSATVITYFSGDREGYVIAGRSLREVEKREGALATQTLVVWALMIVFGFVLLSHKGFHIHEEQHHRRLNDEVDNL